MEDWDDDVAFTPHLTVYEDDDPIDTGLLDQHGRPLYRHKERQPHWLRHH